METISNSEPGLSVRTKLNSLIDNFNSTGITGTSLGMTPSDSGEAAVNANLLISGLNTYGHVIIDDSYYIDNPTDSQTFTELRLSGNINGELITNNSNTVTLFDPDGLTRIELNGVKFRNIHATGLFIVFYSNTANSDSVELVSFDSCIFNGNISSFRKVGDDTVDPSIYGIDLFKFTNNRVDDIHTTGVTAHSIPIRNIIIHDNIIYNMDYLYFSMGIENGSTYEDEMYDEKIFASVKNNYVKNDTTWTPLVTSGYFAFLLYEGTEIEYAGNHVEGITSDESGIDIYDAYLSANIVHYYDNVWKNNILFYTSKINNVLMKSKGGKTGAVLSRNYYDNHFIIEEDFVTGVGESLADAFIYMLEATQIINNISIRNNIFDIYDLRNYGGVQYIENIELAGNTFNCTKGERSLSGTLSLSDTLEIESIIIKDNIINIPGAVTEGMNLVRINDSRSAETYKIGKVIIDNNVGEMFIDYLLYIVITDELTFTNNTIRNKNTGTSGFSYIGDWTNSYMSNNRIESLLATQYYEGRHKYGYGRKYEEMSINKDQTSAEFNSLALNAYDTSITTTYYRRYYYFEDTDEAFYYDFSLTYDGVSHNEISFTDIDDTPQTYRLNKSDAVTDGHNIYIKMIDIGTEANTQNVRFYNQNSSVSVLWINDLSGNVENVKIITRSYI